MRIARVCLVHLMVASLLLTGLPLSSAQAGIIATETLLHSERADHDRARVRDFLGRAEVRDYLTAQGVAPDDALARVDTLTDAEVASIAQNMDRLPAGASTGGDILFVGVVVFIVLLVTDILGYTDIFPFVKKHPRR